MKENIKISDRASIGLSESRQHKPWFDEECSQAKMQWLQDSNESNEHNLNYVRREASEHFRKKQERKSER